ncbi:MAG: hypothetical protein K2I75_00545 [Clostridiales bacterium]|nr:hypothetical protein [Clostridiales bacterium]
MIGLIKYIGISNNGLAFAKVIGGDGKEYYFDSRALETNRMSDYQSGEVIVFDDTVGNKILKVKKFYRSSSNNDSKNQDEFLHKIENWSIEATNEDRDYFYSVKEMDKIKDGQILYVIGRKGTGKSAIVNNLLNSNNSSEHSLKLSFKNFPFNLFYECNDTDYVQPNQYITIWQLIIYRKLATMLIKTNDVDKKLKDKLKQCLNASDSKTNKLIKKIDEFSMGVSILGSGFDIGFSKTKDDVVWTVQLEMFKDIFNAISINNKYFLLFDELDEDYKEFIDEKERKKYISMLTSLFKAIQYVKHSVNTKNIMPIVFLRTDIYNQLTDADKNKWSEYLLELEWNLDTIKEMLAYRIAKTYDSQSPTEDIIFENEFNKIFKVKSISTGNRKSNHMSVFSYMARSTQWRPRDFIKYIKICVEEARRRHLELVTSDIIKLADAKFSDYLKQEIIDEIFPVLPDIHKILPIFSAIRKQSFNPNIFIEEYNKEVSKNSIQDMGAENVLGILFNYNIIGNVPSMKGQNLFKYSYADARFNLRENIVLHRGLYKTLQIF